MQTTHTILYQNASDLCYVDAQSVDLVVTSPPYPMIEMWDPVFTAQSAQITDDLIHKNSMIAFERMHALLDRVWDECFRVLKTGGFACINIGDAVRTLNSNFALYPNHARIMAHLLNIGFTPLPAIIWRKQTNAPNKFMGSGMLPAGAYVTLEHEYILILRKGGKREFNTSFQKRSRRESALFWEERNHFFSDIWFDLKGTRQNLCDGKTRSKSGAFPFELAHRLINMYSVKNDTILDPFLGTGTTKDAAMASGRNSIGCEIDFGLKDTINQSNHQIVDFSNKQIHNRLDTHRRFIDTRLSQGKPVKHENIYYGFPVITAQEKELFFNPLLSAHTTHDTTTVTYQDFP